MYREGIDPAPYPLNAANHNISRIIGNKNKKKFTLHTQQGFTASRKLRRSVLRIPTGAPMDPNVGLPSPKPLTSRPLT